MGTATPTIPADADLPAASGLLAGDGEAVVGRFLRDRGWTLEEARPVQATYRPGRSFLVRYRTRATGATGSRVFTLCAETSSDPVRVASPPDRFAERFGIEEPVERRDEVLVWAYPYDPSLRELPDAAWGPSVRERAGEGVDAVGVQALRYRPRRRAVFRYRMLHRREGWRTSFGKVVPSRKAERSILAATRLHEAGRPVSVSTALSRQTLLAPELGGASLRDLLLAGRSLPSPERLARVVRDIAATSPGAVTWNRPEPAAVAEGTARLLEALVPDLASDIGRVRRAAQEGRASGPMRLVHGDLYEAQVLVGRRFSLGLIDLDDAGLGDPAMDAANVCAHLLVLAVAVPAAAGRLVAYRELARKAFLERLAIASSELAWREALCTLQLAAGPFRVLDPRWPEEVGRRVRLAVRLLEDG